MTMHSIWYRNYAGSGNRQIRRNVRSYSLCTTLAELSSKALIHSDASRKNALAEHRSIKVSTYGIMFMGTPHQGGNGVRLGKLLTNIASLFVAADDHILRHLEKDSEWLQKQLGQYGPISGDFVTKFIYEEYETPTALGLSIMVVPRASAVVPGQADAEPVVIHSNHKNMVKFNSRTDDGYITLPEHLMIMMRAAGNSIRSRWQVAVAGSGKDRRCSR
ncbi:uncharacterized protein BCR38DRAFT_394255 [Pseudomassariella vexata]|uniref:Uncharacterized protein n=1 Tax=Pseudomassariella vexata TaxID=1141098 RepID=A0A1Y2DW91_9PEZI|nr:uncharacterized protein BCR38DRAFT_394255 [Pseudomassariella vexata]ORY63374.1 hypothetical protein BCR38DRAFT_394255 [Pseudomassariella vexata]